MSLARVCDECGNVATTWIHLATGRVMIDDEDHGQDADFCDIHKPDEDRLPSQPKNCERVEFYWPGI